MLVSIATQHDIDVGDIGQTLCDNDNFEDTIKVMILKLESKNLGVL